jgi:hypoxanthine-guanine phosphoribosyltransferase
MEKMKEQLEEIAMAILNNDQKKPNYTNRDFMNCVIIFQTALMDKMYDVMDFDKMSVEERYKMAESSGHDLRKLIYTYTNLDTHKVEDFL